MQMNFGIKSDADGMESTYCIVLAGIHCNASAHGKTCGKVAAKERNWNKSIFFGPLALALSCTALGWAASFHHRTLLSTLGCIQSFFVCSMKTLIFTYLTAIIFRCSFLSECLGMINKIIHVQTKAENHIYKLKHVPESRNKSNSGTVWSSILSETWICWNYRLLG